MSYHARLVLWFAVVPLVSVCPLVVLPGPVAADYELEPDDAGAAISALGSKFIERHGQPGRSTHFRTENERWEDDAEGHRVLVCDAIGAVIPTGPGATMGTVFRAKLRVSYDRQRGVVTTSLSHSDGVMGWYRDPLPIEELRALFPTDGASPPTSDSAGFREVLSLSATFQTKAFPPDTFSSDDPPKVGKVSIPGPGVVRLTVKEDPHQQPQGYGQIYYGGGPPWILGDWGWRSIAQKDDPEDLVVGQPHTTVVLYQVPAARDFELSIFPAVLHRGQNGNTVSVRFEWAPEGGGGTGSTTPVPPDAVGAGGAALPAGGETPETTSLFGDQWSILDPGDDATVEEHPEEGAVTMAAPGGNSLKPTGDDAAPRRTRPAAGNFTMTVRVKMDPSPDNDGGLIAFSGAKCRVRLERACGIDGQQFVVLAAYDASGQRLDLLTVECTDTDFYLRLNRRKDTFTGYMRPTNGGKWVKIGEISCPMPLSLQAGIAVCNGRETGVASARFSEFSILGPRHQEG